jgi:cell wall-associated NlpC family hydrolase
MKKIGRLFLLSLSVFLTRVYTPEGIVFAAQAEFATNELDSTIRPVNPVCDSIVNFAKSFLGKPYKYGAASPAGFDCSGFTWYVFSHFGYQVPRGSKEYIHFGKEIPIKESRPGDIIVFKGTHQGDERAGHVGIVVSCTADSLIFIHSSSSKNHRGVVTTDYYRSNYPKRFIRICRVIT